MLVSLIRSHCLFLPLFLFPWETVRVSSFAVQLIDPSLLPLSLFEYLFECVVCMFCSIPGPDMFLLLTMQHTVATDVVSTETDLEAFMQNFFKVLISLYLHWHFLFCVTF